MRIVLPPLSSIYIKYNDILQLLPSSWLAVAANGLKRPPQEPLSFYLREEMEGIKRQL